MIAEYGGLAKQMPMYATLFLIAALSSMGLPALNGFIGEFTILLGAANRTIVWAVFAAVGIVLGAAYLLWLYQRVFWGPLDNPANKNAARRQPPRARTAARAGRAHGLDRHQPEPSSSTSSKSRSTTSSRKVDPTYFDKRAARRIRRPRRAVPCSAVETAR